MARLLPLRTKLLYGVGELAISAKNAALGQYLLFFYVDIVKVSPVFVGAAIFVGRLWDAVTDPVVGYLSDTTRSRFGRRRPYVVLAAVPMGILFFGLFAPPWRGELGTAVYLATVYVLLMTSFTLFATPYLAWGAELSDDIHERTSVVQMRSLFGMLGLLVGGALPVALAQQFPTQRTGFAVVGAILGVFLTSAALITGVSVEERRRTDPPRPSLAHFLTGLRVTFANRQFRTVFTTFCLMTVALSLGNAVQLFVIKYWLGLYDYFPWIAATFAVSFVASFPLWARLSRRFGKHETMRLGLVAGSILPLGWFLVPPGSLAAMLSFAACGGLAMGSITVVISAAMDVVDLDEWQTGERREGAYFGIWTLGLKTTGALGALLGGVLLRSIGFQADAAPEPERVWWLLVALGPLQAWAHLFGLFALRKLRIDPEYLREIRSNLADRRSSLAASSPSR